MMTIVLLSLLTTTASPPTIVDLKFFPLGTGWDHRFPGIFAAYQTHFNPFAPHGRWHLAHCFKRRQFWRRMLLILTWSGSWLFVAFWLLGEVLPKTQTSSVSSRWFWQEAFMGHLPCGVLENWALRSNSAPAFQVFTLVWREIFIWFLPPNTDCIWSCEYWSLSWLPQDSHLRRRWPALPKPSRAHPRGWALPEQSAYLRDMLPHVGMGRDPLGMQNCTHLLPVGGQEQSLLHWQLQRGLQGSGYSEHEAKEEITFNVFMGRQMADTKHRWLRFWLHDCFSIWAKVSNSLWLYFLITEETHNAMLDPVR